MSFIKVPIISGTKNPILVRTYECNKCGYKFITNGDLKLYTDCDNCGYTMGYINSKCIAEKTWNRICKKYKNNIIEVDE